MESLKSTLDQKVNIVLLEDHVLFRNGFISLVNRLDPRFHFLFTASNGLEFIEKLSTHVLPHIVITDLKMDKMNGFAVIEWMNKHYPSIPVIALTMYNQDAVRTRLNQLGVKGLLLKSNGDEDIVEALDIVLSGGSYFAKVQDDAVIEQYPEDVSEAIELKLSMKEQQFAENLCDRLQLKEIAEKMHISEKTAERYRTNVFRKAGVKTRFEFLILKFNKIISWRKMLSP